VDQSSGPLRGLPDRLLERLSRVTTPGRRFIPEIDGMRFVAIAAVVVVHGVSTVYSLAGGSARFGWTPQNDVVWNLGQEGVWGVQLFFVISGLVLGVPFAQRHLGDGRRVGLVPYYARRLTRLEPPYLVGLTLALIGAVWIGGVSLGELLPHFLSGLFYAHGSTYSSLNPVLLVAWSLEVEVQFYLLAPALACVFAIGDRRLRRAAIVGAGCLAIVLQTLYMTDGSRVSYSLLAQIQYFLAGFLLADVYFTEWDGERPAKRWIWDVVASAVVVVWVWSAYGAAHAPILLWMGRTVDRATIRWVLFPFLAYVLMTTGFKGPASSRFLSNRWVYTIGGMCYSIYLTHTLVIDLARKVTLHAVFGGNLSVELLVQLALVGPVVVVAGAAFFVLIERPCMNPRWPQDLVGWFADRPRWDRVRLDSRCLDDKRRT